MIDNEKMKNLDSHWQEVMKLAENVKVVSIARAKKEDEEEDKQDMTTESTSEN